MGDRGWEDVRSIDLTTTFSTFYPLQPRRNLRGIDLGSIFSRVDRELQTTTGSCSLYYACPPSNSPSHAPLSQAWRAGLDDGGTRRPLALYVPEDTGSELETPSFGGGLSFGQAPAANLLLCTEKLTDSGSDDDDEQTIGDRSDDEWNQSAWFDERMDKWYDMTAGNGGEGMERLLGTSQEESETTTESQEVQETQEVLEVAGNEVVDVPERVMEMGIRQGCSRASIVGANSYMNRLKDHMHSGPIRNEKGWVISKHQLLILCLHLAAKVWQKDRLSMAGLLMFMNESGPDEWTARDVNSAVKQIFELLDYNILRDLLIDVNPVGVDLFCEAYIHVFPWTPVSGL
ncbi:hypothetical protein BSKO_01165 [Bryopsis sp. KO-2023]|nr:hypothetical protein BSKO_01165 [Bryopsis sp. KO-2023]